VKPSKAIVASVLMLSVIAGAQQSPQPVSSYATPGLSVGDQLNVHLYDFPELGPAVAVHVDPEGMIRLPYAGSIHAAGLSQAQLEGAIAASLQSKGIVKQPNVTVDAVSEVNMGVNVLGQVMSPKTVPLFAPAHLSYVLSQVGGLAGFAERKVTILHQDQDPVSVDYDPDVPNPAAMNTLVFPGDTVTVNNRGVYFVGGEVIRPGIYPMGGAISAGQVQSNNGEGMVKHITLLGALAQAGGITAIAARSHLHILRTVDGKRIDIEVNQVKLSEGKVADPLLQPNDIIYLPPSYWRQQTNNLFATALSSITAAAYIRSANF
jgi:polysaccharide export outer membrane protein